MHSKQLIASMEEASTATADVIPPDPLTPGMPNDRVTSEVEVFSNSIGLVTTSNNVNGIYATSPAAKFATTKSNPNKQTQKRGQLEAAPLQTSLDMNSQHPYNGQILSFESDANHKHCQERELSVSMSFLMSFSRSRSMSAQSHPTSTRNNHDNTKHQRKKNSKGRKKERENKQWNIGLIDTLTHKEGFQALIGHCSKELTIEACYASIWHICHLVFIAHACIRDVCLFVCLFVCSGCVTVVCVFLDFVFDFNLWY